MVLSLYGPETQIEQIRSQTCLITVISLYDRETFPLDFYMGQFCMGLGLSNSAYSVIRFNIQAQIELQI